MALGGFAHKLFCFVLNNCRNDPEAIFTSSFVHCHLVTSVIILHQILFTCHAFCILPPYLLLIYYLLLVEVLFLCNSVSFYLHWNLFIFLYCVNYGFVCHPLYVNLDTSEGDQSLRIVSLGFPCWLCTCTTENEEQSRGLAWLLYALNRLYPKAWGDVWFRDLLDYSKPATPPSSRKV